MFMQIIAKLNGIDIVMGKSYKVIRFSKRPVGTCITFYDDNGIERIRPITEFDIKFPLKVEVI